MKVVLKLFKNSLLIIVQRALVNMTYQILVNGFSLVIRSYDYNSDNWTSHFHSHASLTIGISCPCQSTLNTALPKYTKPVHPKQETSLKTKFI